MTTNAMLALVMAECRGPVDRCTGDIKDKLRAAMQAAKGHWMVLDHDTQLRGAIGAVMEHYGKDSPEWERLSAEVEMLRKFSAFLQAAQSGLQCDPPELPEGHEAIGIMGLWHDSSREAK